MERRCHASGGQTCRGSSKVFVAIMAQATYAPSSNDRYGRVQRHTEPCVWGPLREPTLPLAGIKLWWGGVGECFNRAMSTHLKGIWRGPWRLMEAGPKGSEGLD